MRTIEIARQFAGYGKTKEACSAYMLAIHENKEKNPAEELEAAAYILQSGGDYKIAYTCFCRLYSKGHFQNECLSIMMQAFYEPNKKELKDRYHKNCRLLKKYPYLFRKDFPEFEELPIKLIPFDDKSYTPFDSRNGRFCDYIKPRNPVISRNFFKDLEKPIFATDVFSQYELEYLNDNVRKSEYVARENHIYLHYTDWETFCSYLPCLNIRPLLEEQKIVFLIESEIDQYPIDFKARFGIDYTKFPLKPVGIREIHRLIWHTQLSSHNGGDFFNEIFDGHPNLLALPSILLENMNKTVDDIKAGLKTITDTRMLSRIDAEWDATIMQELYLLKDRTDKDILVSIYLQEELNHEKKNPSSRDRASRISPAIFFQPHFGKIEYTLHVEGNGYTTLNSEEYDQIAQSPLLQGFKYIKTFTPMRRPTGSYGATVRFMRNWQKNVEEIGLVSDAISQRILNRCFMIDWQDRLYADSVLVRFEDGKLNPKATFTALAAFLDLPYTESMTYCSYYGTRDPESLQGNDLGFSPAAIYRTYDEYANDAERCYIEYFLRDAYEYYGYDFKYYDGQAMTDERLKQLVAGFTTLNRHIIETYSHAIEKAKINGNTRELTEEEKAKIITHAKEELLKDKEQEFYNGRLFNARVLMHGLKFVNKNGQPLHMMPKLQLDPALLEQPLYH